MSIEHEIQALLQKEIYRGLLGDRSGFAVRPGLGTYRQFLERAGLCEPFSLPDSGSPESSTFATECSRTARQIVNLLQRSAAVDLTGPMTCSAGVIDGERLHRVAGAGASLASMLGAWWFRDTVPKEACAAARVRNGQVLTPPLFRMQWKETIRRRLAIRYDWNSIDRVMSMHVAHRFPAVFARGLAQPAHTDGGDLPMLRGAVEQVWLPWTPMATVGVTDPADFAAAARS